MHVVIADGGHPLDRTPLFSISNSYLSRWIAVQAVQFISASEWYYSFASICVNWAILESSILIAIFVDSIRDEVYFIRFVSDFC